MKKGFFLSAIFLILFQFPAHALQRISEKPDGTGGNERSFYPSISGDGSAIVFMSYANNLVEHGDRPPSGYNTFLWRRTTDDLILLTPDVSEQVIIYGVKPAISANGRYVVYHETKPLNPSPVDRNSLVIHDRDADGNGVMDEPGAVGRIAIPLTNEPQAPIVSKLKISGDGRFVAFVRQTATEQNANGLTDIELTPFLWNRDAGTLTEITAIPTQTSQATTGNGFTSYTPFLDITDISADGRYILFDRRGLVQQPSGPSQVYVYDRFLERITLISKTVHGDLADRDTRSSAMSGNGRFVIFNSDSGNLLNNPNHSRDVFLADRDPDENGVFDDTPENIPFLFLINVNNHGERATRPSFAQDVSLDGNRVLFSSTADNLDPRATTAIVNHDQLYLRDRNRQTTTLLSIGINGGAGDNQSDAGAISDNGDFVTFWSIASNLVANDSGGFSDIFELQTQQTHTACQASRCAELPGAGPLLCVSDRDCTAMHTECTRSGQCVEIPGTSSNTCQSNADCPVIPEQHLACVAQACVSVNGSGTNTCAANSDCVEHTTCTRDGMCIAIPGGTNNSCATNADCASHSVCTLEQACASVAGVGNNSCSADAECSITPPPTGHLYSCTDSDEGDHPARFGTSKVLQDGIRPVAWNWDFCCQGFLKEFYCVQGSIQNRWYYCKNCVEGGCQDEAIPAAENAVPQLCKDLPALHPIGQKSLKRTLQLYYQSITDRIRSFFR